MEKTQRPASKISSLIQEAENKAAAKKKSSIENLNLVKRESPLGGEDNKTDDLSNAPKLPPKPGKNFVWFLVFIPLPFPLLLLPIGPHPESESSLSLACSSDSNNNMGCKGRKVPTKRPPMIQVTDFCDEFEMPPLETMSPFDLKEPLKEDVFFMGSFNSLKHQQASLEPNKVASRIKRVLSAPKGASKSDSRRSIGNLFRSRQRKNRVQNHSKRNGKLHSFIA